MILTSPENSLRHFEYKKKNVVVKMSKIILIMKGYGYEGKNLKKKVLLVINSQCNAL